MTLPLGGCNCIKSTGNVAMTVHMEVHVLGLTCRKSFLHRPHRIAPHRRCQLVENHVDRAKSLGQSPTQEGGERQLSKHLSSIGAFLAYVYPVPTFLNLTSRCVVPFAA